MQTRDSSDRSVTPCADLSAHDDDVTTDIVLIDAARMKRIVEWQQHPLYGEVPYEHLFPGSDPEDLSFTLDTCTDRSIDSPVVRALEPRRGSGGHEAGQVAVPLRRSRECRRHLADMGRLYSRGGFEAALEQLEPVVSPTRGRPAPAGSEFFWLWRYELPGYATRFIEDANRKALSSMPGERALGKRGQRVIEKLFTRGPDRPRGRRPVARAGVTAALRAALRREVPGVRRQVKEIWWLARNQAGPEGQDRLTGLIGDMFGLPNKSARARAKQALGAATRPQYLVNQLLAWKFRLPPREVQRLIAGAR